MKHFFLRAITLSVGLLLSACGGGGGSGPSLDVGGAPGDPPVTSSQVRTQFAEIGRVADRLDMTDLRVWYGPSAGTTSGAECYSAAQCTPGTDEFELIFTPANLSTISPNADIQDRGNRQGVPIVEYSGTSDTVLEFGSLNRPASVDYRTLGGWMDHSFFTVNLWEFERVGWQLWNAASVGVESGSNPVSGSAIWTGAMIGRSLNPNEPEKPGALVLGDSRLTFDFATNGLDVALTGIRSDGGQSYADLIWNNLPVQNGAFGNLPAVPGPDLPGQERLGSIQGAFYGPNHEEVGGVFDRNQIVGAFGAKR